MAMIDVTEEIREKYYFRRSADREFTTPNLPKIVGGMSRRIDRLQTVAQRLSEVLEGSLPPAQQLQRIQQASNLLIVQLGLLEEMVQLMEWSFGQSEDD